MPRKKIKTGDQAASLLTLMIFKQVMRQAAQADGAEPVGGIVPSSVIRNLQRYIGQGCASPSLQGNRNLVQLQLDAHPTWTIVRRLRTDSVPMIDLGNKR